MAIVFDRANKVVEVEAPAAEVTIQQLIDAIRGWEDEQENMDVAQVAKASGKEELGGGLAVGITLELLNDWQVKFEDRSGPDYVQCTVHQGNLVGGIAGNPIKESAYTQVKLILSAAGTVVELEEMAQEASVQELLYRIGIPTSPSIADDLDVIEVISQAVRGKTDKLPDDPADQSELVAHISKEVADLLKKLPEVKHPQGVGRRYWR